MYGGGGERGMVPGNILGSLKKCFPNFDEKTKRMSKLSKAKQQQLLQTSRKNR